MSYSKREKKKAILEQNKAIEKVGYLKVGKP